MRERERELVAFYGVKGRVRYIRVKKARGVDVCGLNSELCVRAHVRNISTVYPQFAYLITMSIPVGNVK